MSDATRKVGLVLVAVLLASPIAAQEETEAIGDWGAPLLWSPISAARRAGEADPVGETSSSGRARAALSAAGVPTTPLPLIGITPCRIANTTGNGGFTGAYGPPALSQGAPRDFILTGQCGIPASAAAVSLNLTVTNTAGPGFIRIFPAGGVNPTVSTLNYVAGQSIANAAVVPLGTGGAITVVAGVSGADFILDTNGYYDQSGVITQVSPGTGLSGGGTSGNVSLGIANGGVGLTQLSPTGSTSGQALVSNGSGVAWGNPAGFGGSLAGEVTGTQGATVVTNAVSGATADSIVRRNAFGSFGAGSISLLGNLNLPQSTGSAGNILQQGNTLLHTTGFGSLFLGALAGNFTTTGTGQNTGIGASALSSTTTGAFNTALGGLALFADTTGSQNTAVGFNALIGDTTGSFNTAVGSSALADNVDGDSNTAFGEEALRSNTSGARNTALGISALKNNTTGDTNLALGYTAGFNLTTGSENIDIRNAGVAGESGTIRIGSSAVQTRAFLAGVRGVTTGFADGLAVLIDSRGQLGTMSSSASGKREIRDVGEDSAALQRLRPVSFLFRNDEAGIRQYGLVAEEVAELMPDLVQFSETGEPENVRYHFLAPLLLSELQREHRKNDQQQRTIEEQRKLIEDLTERILRLENEVRPASR